MVDLIVSTDWSFYKGSTLIPRTKRQYRKMLPFLCFCKWLISSYFLCLVALFVLSPFATCGPVMVGNGRTP